MRPPLPRRRSLGALSLGAALLAAATPTEAQTNRLPGIAVHRTDDAADCPDARALAALVARHRKRPALDPLDAPPSAAASDPRAPAPEPGLDVQIYRSEQGYTAVV